MSTKRFWGLPTGYWWALVACAATTLIATPLRAYLDAANLVMLFLLTVLLIAAYFGWGPAVPVMDYLVSGCGYGAAYFPLKAAMKTLGVIVFTPTIEDVAGLREQKSLPATIASVAATAVERLYYVEVAQRAKAQSDGPH